MISIRIAGTNEAGLIADLSRQTFYETFAAQNTVANMEKFMSVQFSREKLIKEVGTTGNIFLIAWDDDQPVGYARMREGENIPELEGSKAIEIARIYAIQNSIGRGVGTALMEKCTEAAVGLGKEYIWLGVWEKNERAIRFYEKWGFEKFGTHVFELGDDPQTDWLMRKKL